MENFKNFERGYLLPKGCKDLNDVIALQAKDEGWVMPAQSTSKQAPSSTKELLVSMPITVGELAALLKQKPFEIIAELMQLGVFATANQVLNFKTASQVASSYGYTAKCSM